MVPQVCRTSYSMAKPAYGLGVIQERRPNMDLSKIPTADLVQELSKREGVEEFMLEPYQQIKIVVGDNTHIDYGPAVILKIQD